MSKLENNSVGFTDHSLLNAQRPHDLQMMNQAIVIPMKNKPLKMGVTLTLFLSMCLAFLLIQMDDGILSIASEHIIRDLKLTEADLGLIEAVVYLGTTFGCLVCPFLFARLSPKLLVLFGVLSTSCCVSGWVFFNNFWVLMSGRFLNGIFLVSNILKILVHVIISRRYICLLNNKTEIFSLI